MDLPDQGVSPLGAVMSFLYASYIVFNAVLSSVLGKVIDNDYVRTRTITNSLRQVGGIQFSICCGIILLATLIPRGALSFNPKRLDGQKADVDVLDGAVLKQGGSTTNDDNIVEGGSPMGREKKGDYGDEEFSKPVYPSKEQNIA